MLGRTFAGRYRVIEHIGKGTAADVYRASRDGASPDGAPLPDVALKLLRPAAAASAAMRGRFLREALAGSRLSHPHLVETLDAGEDGGTIFLALELCTGRTLAAALLAGPLPLRTAATIARQLASALDAAHARGVVHRDVKPANVFLCDPAPALAAPHAKLLDLGLARVKDELGLTATGALCGTPAYLSPEQIEGAPATPAADLYSLGCVLFEMLTGRPPFADASAGAVLDRHVRDPAPAASHLAPEVPPALDALVASLLAKSPASRPTAAAAAVALDAVHADPG